MSGKPPDRVFKTIETNSNKCPHWNTVRHFVLYSHRKKTYRTVMGSQPTDTDIWTA
jgi:hypothetical protein